MNDQYGPLTQMDLLARKLLLRWVPKWHGAFCDPATGLFHERLGHAFRPVPVPQRRLLTQCRQIAMYAHALLAHPDLTLAPSLPVSFAAWVKHFYVPKTGGWRFSIDAAGGPLDHTYDLYAHAFVLFALAHYGRVYPDSPACSLALSTMDFIERCLRVPGGLGFHEAVDRRLMPVAATRRHESHMHLLEACLFAAQTWDDPVFRAAADDIVLLFQTRFYDSSANLLSEYFTDDLRPAPNKDGHIVKEPGHYGEWIWLLKKHAGLSGDPARYDGICRPMLDWANRYGWDETHGGIYDELNAGDAVIADTKRLWPFAEILKANALMLDSGMDKDVLKAQMKRMVRVFTDSYMDERGFWTEWLSRDLTPATDYMPGTTPYHVYFGIMETRDALAARGRTKSWRWHMSAMTYGARRRLSRVIRRLKALF
jgi:mannose/cellobiose epimerase-like protein (N-acyl-D-glucosamine 2-epimerase family)